MMSTTTPSHILLVRLSAIGDIVMASGLPSSIKLIYPNAKITWLAESPFVELIRNHPEVDNVIDWPKNQWRELAQRGAYITLFKSILRFRRQLKNAEFTLAIDAQGLFKSALFAFWSGATTRIGFNSKEYGQYLLSKTIDKPLSNQISSEYRYLAKYLGTDDYTLHLEMGRQAENSARLSLSSNGIDDNYIVLAPFTTREQKHWPLKHWLGLIFLIRKQTDIPLVILGGPTDITNANTLATPHPNVVSLAGKLSLAESASVIKTCTLLIGVDTGLTHMSVAYKRPTIALFGSTCPYTYTDNTSTHVLYKGLPCAPCKRKPTCDGAYNCMTSLMPSEVINVMVDYL